MPLRFHSPSGSCPCTLTGKFCFEDESYDTVSELINRYYQERRVITRKSGVVLLSPVVRMSDGEAKNITHADIRLEDLLVRAGPTRVRESQILSQKRRMLTPKTTRIRCF